MIHNLLFSGRIDSLVAKAAVMSSQVRVFVCHFLMLQKIYFSVLCPFLRFRKKNRCVSKLEKCPGLPERLTSPGIVGGQLRVSLNSSIP